MSIGYTPDTVLRMKLLVKLLKNNPMDTKEICDSLFKPGVSQQLYETYKYRLRWIIDKLRTEGYTITYHKGHKKYYLGDAPEFTPAVQKILEELRKGARTNKELRELLHTNAQFISSNIKELRDRGYAIATEFPYRKYVLSEFAKNVSTADRVLQVLEVGLPLTFNQIAARLRTSPSNVRHVILGLEERGAPIIRHITKQRAVPHTFTVKEVE